ncbi:ketoacyl-ACP synthase III [Nitriliruptoraceae bacterium ZYF776]|nr:ketoacyl-ACP synthase III [Profundirhabdus halotolerans]
MKVRITGLGSYLPSRVVTNDELSQGLETSDEWIRTRTGIRERRFAAPEEATSDLAVAAAKGALVDAGLGVEDVAAIVVCTMTPDHLTPSTAALVGNALGTEVTAIDVNAACSGFVAGLRVGGALAATGERAVLVVGAETMSRIIDPTDRGTRILFGDGAGAAVLVPDEDAQLGPFDLGADASDPGMLCTPAGGTRRPADAAVLAEGAHYVHMRGGDVYRHAVARMTASSRSVLDAAGLDVDDVDLLVGHQANARILDAVVARLGLDPERSHLTVDRHGNTSAASIPLALTDARDAGRLHDGDRVLLTAFGGGLTWGSCLLTWQPRGGAAPTDDRDDDDIRDRVLTRIEEPA